MTTREGYPKKTPSGLGDDQIKTFVNFPEDVNSMGVRFRLYGCERMRRERMIGEAIVSFAALNLELETNMWLALEPRANTAVSSSLGL